MKYAIKVIETKQDMGKHFNEWTKTNRGWESWVNCKTIWDNINQVFSCAGLCNSMNEGASYYYEVEEVE
jgi:hypothetical protein